MSYVHTDDGSATLPFQNPLPLQEAEMLDRAAAAIQVVPGSAARTAKQDADAVAALAQLVRTHDLLLAQIGKQLRPHGLSVGSFTILVVLDEAGGSLAPSQISEKASVTRAGVTGLVDALERLGLVIREADTSDRRRNRVVLTDAGRELLAWLVPAMQHAQAELMAGLTPTDQRSLRRLLSRIAEHVSAHGAGAVAEP